jgi:hypothetical protein
VAGRAADVSALLADPRIRVGIDMDGATWAPIPDEGLARPFVFLGKQSNYTPGEQFSGIPGKPGPVSTWERDWRLLTGWKRWLLLAGAVHASFTDLGLLADQVGIDIGAGIPGARSLDITRAYVRATGGFLLECPVEHSRHGRRFSCLHQLLGAGRQVRVDSDGQMCFPGDCSRRG